MKVVDANVLLYAVNSDAPRHTEAREWLDNSLSGHDTVGFAWLVLLAFARLATKHGLMTSPLPVPDAWDVVDAWLGAPSAVVVQETRAHSQVVRRLLEEAGTAGNLVNDAHLAALAIEHRAVVVSYDSDFGRFPGVEWQMP